MSEMSNAEVALLNRDDGMFGGNAMFFWVFALLLMNNGFFGGYGNMAGNYVTQAEMTAGLNNQQTQSQLQQIAMSSANNNYETAQLISNQTNQMLQQNNTNLINAIQGFNSVNQSIATQTGAISQQLQALSAQLNECCCSIKTQMLEDRLSNTQLALANAQNTISNDNQSQYILSQLGRFVAWTPSGTQATTAG